MDAPLFADPVYVSFAAGKCGFLSEANVGFAAFEGGAQPADVFPGLYLDAG